MRCGCRRVRRAAALLVAASALVLPRLASGLPQDGTRAIPPELLLIAAANRENSARLQSVQFSGQVVLTGRNHEGHWDPIANRMYSATTRTFSVWRDAANCRLDWTTDHKADPATREVIYILPDCKHIMSYEKLEREGGMLELKRKYGTPRSTTRIIATPTESYNYQPQRNRLGIASPDYLEQLGNEPEIPLSQNKVFGYRFTVADLIDRWAESVAQGSGRSLEVTHLGQGRYYLCFSSSYGGAAAGATHHSVSNIVVDLDQGGNVLSEVRQTNGRIEHQAHYEYLKVGDAWLLVHGETEHGFDSDGVPEERAVYDVTPESVRVNEPIDPYVFTFEALEVPRGTVVFDHETREEYLYDDVPIDVKIALAAEKEHAEEQAEAAARPAADPRPGMPEQPVQYAPPTRNEPALHSAHRPDAGAPLAGTAAPTPPAKETPAPEAPRGPSALKMITPGSRPATQPAVAPQPPRPATRPGTTHVLTPDKAPGPEAAPARLAPPAPASPAKPATGSRISRTVLTTAVVSAGCVAALAIALRKLAQRGVRPR